MTDPHTTRELTIKIKRVCSGHYYATDGDLELAIDRRDDLHGWIVSACWDAYLYTDPIPTYREAKRTAQDIIDHVRAA